MPTHVNIGCLPSEGNATAENVLAGKTFSNDSDNGVAGTMPNNGAWSSTDKTVAVGGSTTVNIPKGYHDGSGKVIIKNAVSSKGRLDLTPAAGTGNQDIDIADGYYTSARINRTDVYNGAYNSGRTQGQNDVKSNPGNYGLESGGSYNNGYARGKSDGAVGSHILHFENTKSISFSATSGTYYVVAIGGPNDTNYIGDVVSGATIISKPYPATSVLVKATSGTVTVNTPYRDSYWDVYKIG